MKNNKFTQFASLAALVFATTPALATVIFDPSTGTGQVGKGDVQDAFLWNNQQLQANAASLEFQVVQNKHYTATCTDADGKFETKPGKFQTLRNTTHNVQTNVTGGGPVNVNSRTNPQKMVTGFMLIGYRSASFNNDQTPPQVGDSCSQGNIIGRITNVVVFGTTELSVNFGGTKRVLAVY